MNPLRLFIFIGFLVTSLTASADFKVPALRGPVMDQVGYLSRSDRQDLMQLIYDFNRRGKAQIQVLIVDSLGGEPIEQASIKITDQWKLGDKAKDNGVLFLISAKDRAMRIEVGQGLEGAIPDIRAKQIISDQVIPLFRAQRFSTGIVVGVHEIMVLADKEFADERNIQEGASTGKNIPVGVIIFLLIVISVLGRFGGGRGRYIRGGAWGGGIGGMGGGGFGGGGGGGWSGGGGGFSGGGASGNW